MVVKRRKKLSSRMVFNEKIVVGPQKSFSHSDLLHYVETLLKDCKSHEQQSTERYSWLKSKNIETPPFEIELEKFKPIVQKLTAENCAAVAVKLDILSEELKSTTEILSSFKKILEQQHNIQMIEGNVKRAKEKKKKNKINRVHPELMPPGRQPTVSFILNDFN